MKDAVFANSMQIGEVELLGVVAAPPTLTIAANGDGSLTLSVSRAGTLHSTTSLAAPIVWTPEGAISGSRTLTPAANEPVKFYRVSVP